VRLSCRDNKAKERSFHIWNGWPLHCATGRIRLSALQQDLQSVPLRA
jgi:hypothetical protein